METSMNVESSLVLPPTYSQYEGVDQPADAGVDPEILVIPASDSVQFQSGHLGVDGERAAVEGELHIKGAEAGRWNKVTVGLRSVESSYGTSVELALTEITLFSSRGDTDQLPTSFPFSIPLPLDTSQCLHTAHSSLAHILTASLHPDDPEGYAVSKSITVHTRRYSSHSSGVGISPRELRLDTPTLVEAQVPRTTFKVGELVPVYVTIPPPPRELVVDQGVRLRNIRVELVRIIRIRREDDEDSTASDSDQSDDDDNDVEDSKGASGKDSEVSSSSQRPPSPSSHWRSLKTVIARSGAPCRFHPTRPVRLRFILHPYLPSGSPPQLPSDLSTRNFLNFDTDSDCASISQTTVLHSVSFRLHVYATFVDMSNRIERACKLSTPIIFLPPAAPLPQVDDSLAEDYRKKHDRPPAKTTRREDAEASAPHYDGVPGPSVVTNGAPPPFEEREAPPPFFSTLAEASTSSRLPTFVESESDIFVPPAEDPALGPLAPPPTQDSIEGEGILFGFSSEEQFDGHVENIPRSSSPPPPTIEMARTDPDVTQLAGLEQPRHVIEALELALEQHEEAARGGDLPPPPPPLDDPADPPPSIDSDFRSVDGHHQAPRSLSPPRPTYAHPPSGLPGPPPMSNLPNQAHVPHGHAPPPYLVPDPGVDVEHVTGPPPYVDL
ncbi:hypothetical protein JAAARDRAFT_148452 [Jaapia argillacea MUCL 33604]|uniref:Uncharacterized protein n=1 Tax=Jaapia argillacea MUCL 33604 TaxID=933084 RepID=A0A067QMB6_9AGAM|nr:hypothetical protein JAAARDRAFT_148452 [Jaapia argillacea MUCL 33604]